MDWLHCNNCLEMGEFSETEFYIGSCGHILCSRCNEGAQQKCLFDGMDCQYTSVSVMKREHETLFADVLSVISRHLKYVDFLLRQYSFLSNALKARLGKHNALKQENALLKSEVRRHREEKNNLKNELVEKHLENRMMKKQLELYQTRANQNYQSNYFDKRSESSGQIGSQYLLGSHGNQSSFSSPSEDPSKPSNVFTPPKPVSLSTAYRKPCATPVTPRTREFPSPPSSERSNTRSVLLPGDRGSSPINRIQLQRLNLKCTPNFERGSSGSKTPRRAARPGFPTGAKYNNFF